MSPGDGMTEFHRLLDRKLEAGNHRRWQRVVAWAGLLDAAGWCVAVARSDGSIWLGEHGEKFLEHKGERPSAWQDLVAILERSPEIGLDLKSQSVCVWCDRDLPAECLPLPTVPLTKREMEVWEWIRRGKTVSEVAVILGCASRTVETHVANLYRKIGVRNRGAAILGKPGP